MDEPVVAAAKAYATSGLSVIPCRRIDKRPTVPWRTFQSQAMTAGEIEAAFAGADAVGIVCGTVSGNLEMIDFDLGGEAFEGWRRTVEAAIPGLIDRLVIEETQSGGLHVAYRIQGTVPGNRKLAERRIAASSGDPVRIGSRPYTPRRDGDGYTVTVAIIETRGEGGMFLAAPSPGYRLIAGDFDALPVLTVDEQDVLIGAAQSMSDTLPPVECDRQIGVGVEYRDDRPGDAFNAGGEIDSTLRSHGWTFAGDFDGQQHWRRPGKDHGTSATFRDGVLFVFSSNADPFEAGRGYSRFAVYAILEHGGDYTAAASSLARLGFGRADDSDIDLSSILLRRAPTATGGEESADGSQPVASQAISYRVLVESTTSLRPVVIDGLLREGESMNVIASPKTGKSWLTIDLALSVATGTPWLGRFGTSRGRVLVLDNELHRETSAHRFPLVAEARGIDERDLYESLYLDNLRGRLLDFHRLRPYLESIPRGWYRVVVLDAFYRFLPNDVDENANGDMSRIYSLVDYWADRLGAAFILVHHTSKGSQALKSVTDVGSGAGAQSRATDSHLVLRQHEEDNVIVLDAAVRSFAPIEPICLRWDFPLFTPDYLLDPSDLRSEGRSKRKPKDASGPDPDAWDVDRFVFQCVREGDVAQRVIEGRATAAGLSERLAKRFLKEAIATGKLVAGPKRYSWRRPDED